LLTFIRLFFSSRTALVAENLFLRKQLAMFQERKARPRRTTASIRLAMVALKGIARALMQIALEWSAANHLDVVILHASDDGRGLYESFGFEPTNEMRLIATHR
jgi:hypothetical protein